MTALRNLLLLACFCLLQQGVGKHIPDKEHLCGLIVDTWKVTECLQCFTEAGSIKENPDGVRACVGTFLPPKVADCSVPHDERVISDGMQQKPPSVHPNHTNANLLPNCLRRRMRDMSRYLKREKFFAQQAGNMVKKVVESNLVTDGGPAMIGIVSQRYILAIPRIERLVQKHASGCLEKEEEESEEDKSEEESKEENEGADEDPLIEDKDIEIVERLYNIRFPSFSGNLDDQRRLRRLQTFQQRTSSPLYGNGLPFGGTSPLTEEILKGECIVQTLTAKRKALELVIVLSNDELFLPVPAWWVKPLLGYYKAYRENLEAGNLD